MDRPIPAFYCVYLLRSQTKRSFYIGSSPHPRRRLLQHHGRGGAAKTKRSPHWDMVAFVKGFPSKISALQFEWAWQHPYKTRHITPDKRPATSGMSMLAKLKSLHLLLQSATFARSPLQICFFDTDVFDEWQKKIAAGAQTLPDQVTVTSHDRGSVAARLPIKSFEAENGYQIPDAIAAIDVSYGPMKRQVARSLNLLDGSRQLECAVCHTETNSSADLLVCPEDCGMVAHSTCLANEFLRKDRQTLVPTQGSCPKCAHILSWSDMARDLSLRKRGHKELVNVFKTRKSNMTTFQDEVVLSSAAQQAIDQMSLEQRDADSSEDEEDVQYSPEKQEELTEIELADPPLPKAPAKAPKKRRRVIANSQSDIEEVDLA